MIIDCSYFNVQHMWRDPEMWGDDDFKIVSSMKYYDGVDYHGGTDMSVYDEEKSKPRFLIHIPTEEIGYVSGCVSYFNISDTIRVRGLFVKKRFRGRGIAEDLLRRVIHEIPKGNLVWALAGPNSMRVHEKVGFVPVTEKYHQMPDGNVSKHHNCYMRYDT